jgi:hypothetical protein
VGLTGRLHSRALDLVVSGALLSLLGIVAVWNAFSYPPIGGFDAAEHITYARDLVERGELAEGGASYTPPGFYVLAGGAIKLGEALGMDEPERVAQLLNAAFALGGGLLVLALSRLLFPGRPVVRWAALAFFVCCPVVLKTVAMFHPQPFAMFLSLLAFWITARMIVRRDYRARLWIALALSLGAAQLVRSVSVWTVGVVLFTLVAAGVAQPEQRRRIRNALAISAVGAVLVPLPWYIHLQTSTSSAVLGRGIAVASFENFWPAAFYVSPGLPDVITHPHREALEPLFFPILYAETWGDYFGIWSWGAPRPELTPDVNRRLAVQSVVGLPLTFVAVAGWVALAGLGVRRWREAPARLIVALAPLAGLAAVLYYATRGFRADGDIVKAMFMLPAVPFWALSFGFAVDVLYGRSRRVALPVLAVLAVCGAVSLVYATFASVS